MREYKLYKTFSHHIMWGFPVLFFCFLLVIGLIEGIPAYVYGIMFVALSPQVIVFLRIPNRIELREDGSGFMKFCTMP